MVCHKLKSNKYPQGESERRTVNRSPDGIPTAFLELITSTCDQTKLGNSIKPVSFRHVLIHWVHRYPPRDRRLWPVQHPVLRLQRSNAGNAAFDYVIVGGGMAGLTIAARLADQKFQVASFNGGWMVLRAHASSCASPRILQSRSRCRCLHYYPDRVGLRGSSSTWCKFSRYSLSKREMPGWIVRSQTSFQSGPG